MASDGQGGRTTSSRISGQAAAEYLDDLLSSAKRLATEREFGFLAYLVEMAANEAARLARANDNRPSV